MIKKWVEEKIGVGLLIMGMLLLMLSIGERVLGTNPRPFLNQTIGSGGLALVLVSIQQLIKHQMPSSNESQIENEGWVDERRVINRLRSKEIALDVMMSSYFIFIFQVIFTGAANTIDELIRSLVFLLVLGYGTYLLARILYGSPR